MRETAPRHKKEVTMGVAVVVIIAVVALVAIVGSIVTATTGQ
jgi:hypothetical protein